MCRLRNIAMCDYQESVTGQTLDKVIPICRYASQATQIVKVIDLGVFKRVSLVEYAR